MTKSELIDVIARRLDITKSNATIIVNTVFDSIIDAMMRGERVEIRNFGNITMRQYKSYTGRNPKTGDPVEVPGKRMPFFKVGRELRQRIQ